MKTVFCPIKNDQIDGGDCYWLCAIANDEITDDILPDGISYWNEEQQKKCLNCKYHKVLTDKKEF